MFFDVENSRDRSTVFLERVSPEVIFLRPPEKLVIEVKAIGRFRNVRWFKNGLSVTLTEANSANHLEIYVRDPTTSDDLTLYEVNLRAADVLGQRNVPGELDFSVTPPGKVYVISGNVVIKKEYLSNNS